MTRSLKIVFPVSARGLVKYISFVNNYYKCKAVQNCLFYQGKIPDGNKRAFVLEMQSLLTFQGTNSWKQLTSIRKKIFDSILLVQNKNNGYVFK